MNNRPVPELQTDPEFDELIQPREEKYLEELEENIFDHGCQEPVCVWNGTYLTAVCGIKSVRNGISISTSGASCLKAVIRQSLLSAMNS